MNKILAAIAIMLSGALAQAHTIQEVCSLIASYNSQNGIECVKAISTANYFDVDATEFCYVVSTSSSTNGVACVKSISGNRFQTDAVAVCTLINSYNSANGLACIAVIANKQYLNGTAELCKNIAASSSTNGLICMRDSGVPAGKTCPTLKETSDSIGAALDEFYNGKPRTAVKMLQGLQDQINTCLQ